MDIVRDTEFTKSNRTFDGHLKSRTESGTSRPTQHKEIVSCDDLKKMSDYLQGYENSPIILREAAWYLIAIHFITRGMEFHYQLRKQSIEFREDSDGEFLILNQETKEINHQGGANKKSPLSEKRIYATGGALCPVTVLKLFIRKQNTSAKMLFNQIDNNALANPCKFNIWYTEKPLAKRTFEIFMKNISATAGLHQQYTAHCLHATAIQTMNDAGYEARHIMFMSGHRNEASIRSYNRGCSTSQKKSISNTLSALTEGASHTKLPGPSTALQPYKKTHISLDNDQVPPCTQMVQSSKMSNEQNISHADFFRAASFSNCTINISKPQ